MLSLLTRERPEIWQAGIALVEATMRVRVRHRAPNADGTVSACGGGGGYWTPPTPSEPQKAPTIRDPSVVPRKRNPTPQHIRPDTVDLMVPDGAMEWLLHEAGHWVASTPEERKQANYGLNASEVGHDGDREWQAWAFEEIVLAPFGPSRDFAPPSQRDGAAYTKAGPMRRDCLQYIDRQIATLGLDIERWRVEWGAWVRWGRTLGDRAPWRSER